MKRILITIFFYCLGCAHKTAPNTVLAGGDIEPRKDKNNITPYNFYDYGSAALPHAAPKFKKKSKRPPIKEDEGCVKLISTLSTSYAELISNADSSLWNVPPEDAHGFRQVSRLTSAACNSRTEKSQATKLLSKYALQMQQRVGIIVSKTDQPSATAALTGLNMSVENDSLKNNIIVKWLQTDTKAEFDKALSELILKYRVSSVVTGLSNFQREQAKSWSQRVFVPFLVLGPTQEPTRGLYSISPSEATMGIAIANLLERMQYKRIAILKPTRNQNSPINNRLIQLSTSKNISIVHNETYNDYDFESIQASVNRIFEIDPVARQEEFQVLFEKEKERSESLGVSLDTRFLRLPPKVEVDAVVILDHFKNVRHIAKLFSHIGVKHMPMVGHYEWRGKELLSPPEPLLNGGLFVDFVGPLAELPKPLYDYATPQGEFIAPDKAADFDFMLIGYKTGEVLKQIKPSKKVNRLKYRVLLDRVQNKKSPSLQKGRIFATTHEINWPAFSFRIENGRLVPYK
jgi:hypothetical protein